MFERTFPERLGQTWGWSLFGHFGHTQGQASTTPSYRGGYFVAENGILGPKMVFWGWAPLGHLGHTQDQTSTALPLVGLRGQKHSFLTKWENLLEGGARQTIVSLGENADFGGSGMVF